mmetsp:Transcript_25004/g.47496  ORF Transcript_25004/g.47496 Transcript_25004/m.47496 type:complete len:131 (-) Transcript_25004:1160-1552(-)
MAHARFAHGQNAQDQTWMEDNVRPFSVDSSDITSPLVEASCQRRYVVHFTRMSNKWSWCKILMKKNVLVETFKEFELWVDSMKDSVNMMRMNSESNYVHGAFAKYCQDCGIRVSPSVIYLKEMNGISERL